MKLNRYELRSVLVIGTIIALRLLGIFLIIPVFSIYAVNYEGATLSSAGVAFGIYALTQSLLQIPFGMASDRFGRKPVIVFGLLIFCIGSVLCAFADNIWELIITRAIQGSGAIGAVAIAVLGDCTRNEVRAQSFMLTGIIIGTAFITSLIVGPVLAGKFGFESLFLHPRSPGINRGALYSFPVSGTSREKTKGQKRSSSQTQGTGGGENSFLNLHNIPLP